MGWIEGRRRWVWLAGLIFGALLLTPVGASGAVPAESGDDILVFVAHPDDDIITAAGVIKDHVDAGGDVTVAFLTNGDRCATPGQCSELDPDIGTVRQGEAVAAQGILGVAENQLTFLGYPNGFVDAVRYGSGLPSELAHTETYASRGMGSTDWHDHRMGAGSQHAAYTGANMLDDVEALLDTAWLATHRPDHIFTHSPWDRHPDHRVTYLTLVNAVDRVQAIDPSYQPYIHTTIVHVKDSDQWGLWPATPDPSTPINEYSDLGVDSVGELVWDQRESFEVPASMQNPYFPTSGNPKAAAIEAHASQVAEDNYFIRRFAHKDEIFWVEKLGAAEGRPDAHSVDEGGTLSVAASGILSNDVRGLGDPPNPPFDPTYLGPMAAQLVDAPDRASSFALDADGAFTYTHDGSEGATDSFTYRPVQGSTLGSIATVTININPVNDAPTAFADGPYAVTKGKSRTIPASGVLGNDTDPDNDPLTAVKDSDPDHGTLTLNGDGSFTYTHLGGTATTDSFTYHVRDPGGLTSGPVTVSLQINPVELPVMTDIAGSVFKDDILWLVEEGITKGCNPPQNDRFCPDAAVTRGQMAAFMVRFLGLTASDASIVFGDTVGTVFEDDIRKLATAGITRGCNPPANTQFCPNATVTRGQMAAFLVRALDLTDNGGGDLFTDDDTSVFESDIDRLATAGVTKGCNADGTHFCPNGSVTRGQMAAFLHRAEALLPQG